MPTLDDGQSGGVIRLTANVDCEECGTTYDGVWEDDSISLQDMAEAPVADQNCPHCGHVQEEEYPGWAIWSEAG